jgi:redox-sensitive bicupin YhaK (pirin superfamily)
MHGIQLWVAQPEATRHGDAEFEHHTELPRVAVGSGTATVLVGGVGDTTSAARRDTDHIGVDLDLHAGQALLPIRPAHEHALIVLAGAVQVAGEVVTPGHLAYLGLDRSELALRTDDAARALLIGGLPFEAPILMWWNFVARSRDEVDAAQLEWNERGPRFGDTGSPMERIPAPIPPWRPDPR